MINIVKYLRMRKEAAGPVLPERLRPYLDKRLLPSAWYPEEDHIELCRVLAKILPDPGMDVYEFIGESGARADLSGPYGHLIRPGDPAGTLQKGVAIWHTYHDTGLFRVVLDGPGAAHVELFDFGASTPDHCRLQRGWNRSLMRMAGAKDVEVEETRCVHRRNAFCRWEIRWAVPEMEMGSGMTY
jgi:hypothetical protein